MVLNPARTRKVFLFFYFFFFLERCAGLWVATGRGSTQREKEAKVGLWSRYGRGRFSPAFTYIWLGEIIQPWVFELRGRALYNTSGQSCGRIPICMYVCALPMERRLADVPIITNYVAASGRQRLREVQILCRVPSWLEMEQAMHHPQMGNNRWRSH